MKTERT